MKYTCYKCGNEYATKFTLLRHSESCKEKISDSDLYEILLTNEKEKHKLQKELQKKNEEIEKYKKEKEKNKEAYKEKENNNLKKCIKEKDIIIKQKNDIINNLNISQNITCRIDCDLHDTLIDINDNHSGVYLAFISDNIVKFGRTNTIRRRACEHLKDFGQFQLFFFVRNFENAKLENILKNHQMLKPHLTTMVVNGTTHYELFILNQTISINIIKSILLKESKKLHKHQILLIQEQIEH